ncbi:lipoprotein [Angustibacter aerolatus]
MSARVRRRRSLLAFVLLVTLVTLTVRSVHGGGGDPAAARPAPLPTTTPTAGTTPSSATPSTPPSQVAQAAPSRLDRLAGLGPRTSAKVPASAGQVVVVQGDDADGGTSRIALYQRSGSTWTRTAGWSGHNGAKGWTTAHREGDLRTPVGVFTLSDAGGRMADPGTKLPYHRSTKFEPSGSAVFGDSLAGSFDYVVAVDFNRQRGVSPLDTTRPQGWDRGGGIWLHVDHDGPTHGCVSVPEAGMRTLLRALDPAQHPVVVMGDATRLRA